MIITVITLALLAVLIATDADPHEANPSADDN